MAAKARKTRKSNKRPARRTGGMTPFATLTLARAASADTAADAATGTATEADPYLLSLLTTQTALDAALTALTARSGEADAEETAFIAIQKKAIQADSLKIDAQIQAYLASATVIKPMGTEQLAELTAILHRIQSFTAKRDKASAIVDAVTELLSKWNP